MERGTPSPPLERRGLGGATSRNRNTGRLLRGREITSVPVVNWEAQTLRILRGSTMGGRPKPFRPRGACVSVLLGIRLIPVRVSIIRENSQHRHRRDPTYGPFYVVVVAAPSSHRWHGFAVADGGALRSLATVGDHFGVWIPQCLGDQACRTF